MDKKKILLLGIFLIVAVMCAYIKVQNKYEIINEDAIKFKEEYESLNSEGYKKVEISENNQIKYSDYEEIVEILENGTGVIYLGFPECPWCRNAVPVLLDAASETGVETIYYYNALSIRDKKHLDDEGNIVVDEEGTEEYKKLVELLYDHLDSYDGLNDDTIKRIYFPTVIFVKDGKVIGLHTSTVDSQTDPSVSLTDEQYEELKDIYVNYSLNISDALCSDNAAKKC